MQKGPFILKFVYLTPGSRLQPGLSLVPTDWLLSWQNTARLLGVQLLPYRLRNQEIPH